MMSLFWCLSVALILVLVQGLEDFVPSNDNVLASSRNLESNDGNFESYLVDKHGNEYEPYSLAWRYLGMYIDCDVDTVQASQQEEEDEGDRRLENDDDNDCARKLLWAAYVDPRYKGGSIGEYQFYDWYTDSWDKSTCETRRCAKMDCHLPNTHFRLVGVFVETEGMYDWAEQLFKHEGYCVWNDDDKYDLMQNHLGDWPSYCIQLTYPDSNGNTLYWHTLPQAEGNVTMGIFTDSSCTQVSETTTFYDYVEIYYYNYYGSSDYGAEQAAYWEYGITMWNEYMNEYKVCQPCRAYSRYKNTDNDNSGDRLLENNDNDGEGDEEQWGYNCYDDAGYTNCNQCYKFETKTSLEPATRDDLVRASKQGSLLRIKVNGRVYGSGGFGVSGGMSALGVMAIVLGVSMLVGGIALIVIRHKFLKRKLKELPGSFREELQAGESYDSNASSPRHGGGMFLLLQLLSRWFQKKLPAPCAACGGGDVKVEEKDDASSSQEDDVKYLPPID